MRNLFRSIYRIIVILSMLMISVIGFMITAHAYSTGRLRILTVGLMLFFSGIALSIGLIMNNRH
ncbi:MAG: hypothetical protein JW971_09885 [Synergistales bacterium]|nr:hypothetical protein [Synergistales bacterium]